MRGRPVLSLAAVLAVSASLVACTSGNDGTAAAAAQGPRTGNMIFIHPDGADAAVWEVARDHWYGPDGVAHWDRLPVAVPYRGHASDSLTTSSNGGATTHAFGFKTDAPDSFGTDTGAAEPTGGNAPSPRRLEALSGYPGSWLREAANAGLPVGVVNDGDVAEPGTAAFLTEVTERSDASALEIARQLVQGRPGFDAADAQPVVVMGGGEDLFFPAGTPVCGAAELGSAATPVGGLPTTPATCVVHREPGDTVDDDGPSPTGGLRTDGLNVAAAAVQAGYTLVRTRAEFEALRTAVQDRRVDPAQLKVLGLFAVQDIFNAETEEDLAAARLVDPSVPVDARETNLVLYGSEPGTPGYRPPTAPEMTGLAATVLQAHGAAAGRPFATVWEVEGTDNMANSNNGIGTLLETRYADEVIAGARDFLARNPDTTILTAADGNAGGLQAYAYNVDEPAPATVASIDLNPGATEGPDGAELSPAQNTVDGRYGAGTAPFTTAPDQFGQQVPFALAWTSTEDLSGAVVSRAEGLAAPTVAGMSARFDNVDVYRIAYLTLFGQSLAYPTGRVAPTRPEGAGAAGATPGRPRPDRVTERVVPAV
jgi:alkaline phosphatase